MIKQIENNILGIKLPEVLIKDTIHLTMDKKSIKFRRSCHLFDWGLIDLPPGNWEVLGLLDKLTEEEMKRIVETKECTNNGMLYLDYKDGIREWHYILNDSFKSWKGFHQLYTVNPLKKSHFNPEEFDQEEYDKYCEAENNTGNWLILTLKEE